VSLTKGPSQGSGAGLDQPGVPVMRPGGTDRVGIRELLEWLEASETGALESNRLVAVTVLIRELLMLGGDPPADCRRPDVKVIRTRTSLRSPPRGVPTGCGPTGGNGFREVAVPPRPAGTGIASMEWQCGADKHAPGTGASGAAISLTSPARTAIP